MVDEHRDEQPTPEPEAREHPPEGNSNARFFMPADPEEKRSEREADEPEGGGGPEQA